MTPYHQSFSQVNVCMYNTIRTKNRRKRLEKTIYQPVVLSGLTYKHKIYLCTNASNVGVRKELKHVRNGNNAYGLKTLFLCETRLLLSAEEALAKSTQIHDLFCTNAKSQRLPEAKLELYTIHEEILFRQVPILKLHCGQKCRRKR